MKIIFTFLVLILNLHSFEILKLEKESISLNTIGYTYFIKESEDIKEAKDVLNNPNLILSKNNYLGIRSGYYWTQFSIKNDTDKSLDLFISSEHSGVNYLDIYVFDEKNKLEKTYLLGDMRPQNQREILHHKSVLNLKLNPNEIKTIVARFDNPGMYKINWSIKDSINFINDDNKYILYLIILSAIVFFISFNSIVLFKIYKTKAYLIIMIEALSVFFYVLSLYGYLYQMNVGIPLLINTLLAWIGVFLTAIARLVFPMLFFNMKEKYRKTTWIIYFFIVLFIVELSLLLYGQHVNGSLIGKFEFIILITFTLYPIVLVFISLYFIFKKEKYAIYYFLIQFIVATISTIHTLSIIGILKLSLYNPYLMHGIIVFDAMFILTLQYFASRNRYLEQVKQNEMLLEQSRFYSIGQAIGNITHQWKHPLSRISGTVTALDFMMQTNKTNIGSYIETKIDTLKSSINEMKYTVDNFTNIFTTELKSSDFKVKEFIEKNVLSILETKIIEKNVTITLDVDEELSIRSHKHILSNIMMILIDNSIDAFKNLNDNNQIWIECIYKNDNFTIIFKDNAGGIKIKPIEKVFDYFVSQKEDKIGSGIGLPLLKILVCDKLNGRVDLKNIENGCQFEIEFNIENI